MLTAFNKYRVFDNDKNIYCETTNKIFIKYKLINNDINIIVNREQRPATHIAGSQGDHITAYTVLLQTLCNALDGVEEYDAPAILYEAVGCFFENLEVFKFKSAFDDRMIDFVTKLKEIETQIFAQDASKEVTNFLYFLQNNSIDLGKNNHQSIQQTLDFIRANNSSGNKKLDVAKLSDCIKINNKIIFAEFVVELGEQILSCYNKQHTAALPKLTVYNNDIAEGFRIKKAMLALKLLNKLIQFKNKSCQRQRDLKVLSNEFKYDCFNLIKSAFGQIKLHSVFNKKFNDFIKTIFVSKLHKINLDNIAVHIKAIDFDRDLIAANVGKLFNDLFDFKQNKFRKIKQDNLGNNIEQDGQVVDNNTKIALQDPLRCLYEVTARHENFMFTAFSSLNSLTEEVKNGIIDGFHAKIIASSVSRNDNNQGWGEWILYTAEQQNTYFTKSVLDGGVQEFHNGHFQPKSYKKAKSARKCKLTI